MDYHLLGLILAFLISDVKVLAGYPIWWYQDTLSWNKVATDAQKEVLDLAKGEGHQGRGGEVSEGEDELEEEHPEPPREQQILMAIEPTQLSNVDEASKEVPQLTSQHTFEKRADLFRCHMVPTVDSTIVLLLYTASGGQGEELGCRRTLCQDDQRQLNSLRSLALGQQYTSLGSQPILCGSIPGLVPKQLRFCRNYIEIMPSVAEGVKLGIQECQHQFRGRRWNCTTIDDSLAIFGPVLDK
ncbi:Proto-oncogene Wnt-3, partial [Varanus komodoensis]